nr:uncharacterized protein CI109_006244 [Kwoniella shandongensis]KAA5525440.1 hypothetical protein CI109_006244 [Kwoniella shandongensis]
MSSVQMTRIHPVRIRDQNDSNDNASDSAQLSASTAMPAVSKITFAPPPLREFTATELYLASGGMFLVSVLSLLLGISFFYCPAHIWWIRPICDDTHYKYLVPLLVPVTAWFAIANWVGWEYFRARQWEDGAGLQIEFIHATGISWSRPPSPLLTCETLID